MTSGRKYWADGAPVLGQQFDYTFDDIGNRKTAVTGGDQWGVNKRYQNYSANPLNQYSQRTVPGYADVVGTANSNATVTVQSGTGVSPASRKGEYFRSEVRAENWLGPVWLGVTNVAVLPDGQNSDIVTNTTGHLVVPQTPEVFAHDADGNLTRDGVWTNFWDAENRLVAQETLAAVYGAGAPRQRLEYDYDPQGRRLVKRAYDWVSGNWSLKYAVRFVWDGWNLLAEVNPTNHLGIRSYGWGLDLSGSEQGAGGVGGLLWVSEHGTAQPSVHFAAYDGNGNVAALVDAVAGTVSANYEYGPFGETIRQTGPLSKANPFRFSTKYQEEETGCLYYGYRSYNPSAGKWLSRDPIGEEGGVNLYGLVANTPVNGIDVVGLAKRTVRHVGKSFINGIGPLGSLGSRAGLPSPPGIISVDGVDLGGISGDGQYADQRLAIFASVIPDFARAAFGLIGEDYDPFNQNPDSDAKDGQYRLYGKIEITARCCGRVLYYYSYDTDEEGGKELPGIRGTINMDVDDGRGAWGFSPFSATVTWKTWGRPNALAEPGMQWVGFRTSVNIWHEGKVKITCSGGNPIFEVLSFRGSRYPSRRLWEDGVLIRDVPQGSLSDLWRRQSWWEPTMVAE